MTDEEKELGLEKPTKLVDIEYSYENIMLNPILKAIAETDRTLIDLMEMAYKKTKDAVKDKKEINEAIQSIPAYQASNLIRRLMERNQEIDDLIKIQNLIIRNLRGCVKEMYNLVMSKYGVYKEEKKEVEKIDYKKYLASLLEKEDIKDFVQLIVDEFDKNKSTTNEKRKFEEACGNIYVKQNKKDQTIIAKIMRMEY